MKRSERFDNLSENRLHKRARDVRQTEVPTLEEEGELRMVDAQAVQNRRLQVVNMDRIADDVVSKIIGLAEDRAWLHASAGHPHREATGMMIATVVGFRELALAVHGAAELAAPDDKRVVEQARVVSDPRPARPSADRCRRTAMQGRAAGRCAGPNRDDKAE